MRGDSRGEGGNERAAERLRLLEQLRGHPRAHRDSQLARRPPKPMAAISGVRAQPEKQVWQRVSRKKKKRT